MTTLVNYEIMTDEQLRIESDKYANILDSICPCDNAWDEAYREYFKIQEFRDERYRQNNQKSFDKFYNEHIKGKTWEEIDPDDWGFYSDWHKDMYGHRPRRI